MPPTCRNRSVPSRAIAPSGNGSPARSVGGGGGCPAAEACIAKVAARSKNPFLMRASRGLHGGDKPRRSLGFDEPPSLPRRCWLQLLVAVRRFERREQARLLDRLAPQAAPARRRPLLRLD